MSFITYATVSANALWLLTFKTAGNLIFDHIGTIPLSNTRKLHQES